jgi:hypothetical protein
MHAPISDRLQTYLLNPSTCPACELLIIRLYSGPLGSTQSDKFGLLALSDQRDVREQVIYPRRSARPPCPPAVPANIASDYNEAGLVLEDSPKASAALSRRCLQNLLREGAKVKPAHRLIDEIKELLERKELPGYLANDVDAIRQIGNFAAHPSKDRNTGEIVEVMPHEAEWNLQVLEGLFDFYYVQPELAKKRRADLDAKLAASGGKPMLQPPSSNRAPPVLLAMVMKHL